MVLDIGDFPAGHSPIPISTETEAAVLESTLCTPLQATTAAHVTPHWMDAPMTPHAMLPTGIVTSHAPHSPHLLQAPLMPPHRPEPFLSQQIRLHSTRISAQKNQAMPRPSTPNKHHCSMTVTIQDSSSDSLSDCDSSSDPLNY